MLSSIRAARHEWLGQALKVLGEANYPGPLKAQAMLQGCKSPKGLDVETAQKAYDIFR